MSSHTIDPFDELVPIENREQATAWEWIEHYIKACDTLGFAYSGRDAADHAIERGSRLAFKTIQTRGITGNYVFNDASPEQQRRLTSVGWSVVSEAAKTGVPIAKAVAAIDRGGVPALKDAIKNLSAEVDDGVSGGHDWQAKAEKAADALVDALEAYENGEWDTDDPFFWTHLTTVNQMLTDVVSARVGDELEKAIRA